MKYQVRCCCDARLIGEYDSGKFDVNMGEKIRNTDGTVELEVSSISAHRKYDYDTPRSEQLTLVKIPLLRRCQVKLGDT